MEDIVVIGGGASGLACALAACEQALRAGRTPPRILILEATDKIGRPILRSGNGRCNFTNARIAPEAYNHPVHAERVFTALEEAARAAGLPEETPNPVASFFGRFGLVWREESEGRLYPLANKASVVLDILRAALCRFGVRIRLDAAATKVALPRTPESPFTVHLQDGELVRARRVVIAAGGTSNAGGAFGLEDVLPCQEPHPVLGPLATEGRITKPLDNIRVRCTARLARNGEELARERGEVQFRTYGVSGIAVFNLSRAAVPGDVLQLDLAPDLPAGAMEQRRVQLAGALGAALTNAELLQGVLLPRVVEALLKAAQLDGAQAATAQTAAQLERQLHGFALTVRGIGDADLCQVMRGGFALEAFNARTLEAECAPGLHVTGEALDMDAACGGFNLHWAFATGMLAGWHAERALAGQASC